MGLLHQLGHSGLDLRSGGVIQLPQAARVALFRGDLGIPAEPADADRDPGPAAGAAGAGDKDGAGGDPPPPGVVQQLPPEAVGQALGHRLPREEQDPLARRLHRHLFQLVDRQSGGGEQLDQQIDPLLSQSPGGGQQAQVFAPGQLQLGIPAAGEPPRQLELPAAQPLQEAVGRGHAGVDRAGGVSLVQQLLPPLAQGAPADAAAGQGGIQQLQLLSVGGYCAGVPPSFPQAGQIGADLLPGDRDPLCLGLLQCVLPLGDAALFRYPIRLPPIYRQNRSSVIENMRDRAALTVSSFPGR